jgi:hypothetical protein
MKFNNIICPHITLFARLCFGWCNIPLTSFLQVVNHFHTTCLWTMCIRNWLRNSFQKLSEMLIKHFITILMQQGLHFVVKYCSLKSPCHYMWENCPLIAHWSDFTELSTFRFYAMFHHICHMYVCAGVWLFVSIISWYILCETVLYFVRYNSGIPELTKKQRSGMGKNIYIPSE